MVSASELKPGMAIRLEGEPYKVIGVDSHAGGGKMGGVAHVKLRSLRTGSPREWRFRADERVEPLELDRQSMQFLYAEGGAVHFMSPATFDQVEFDGARLGPAAAYLVEGMVLPLEFLGGEPVGVVFPDLVELRVAETAPPFHTGGTENVWKEARLENGVTIMVPPFIAPNERIRVDVQAGSYVSRAKEERPKRP
jgi:elongation factor P